MKFCLSLGIFDFKYFLYFTMYAISTLIINVFIYHEDKNNIINKHIFLDYLFLFVGYLLNFIPEWFSNKKSKSKEKQIINEKEEENNKSIEYIYNNPYDKYLSLKDISKILFICIIILLKELIEISSIKLHENYEKEKCEYNFNIIQFLIIYLFSKYTTQTYYKHQNFSFLIFSLVEIIKIIFVLIRQINDDSYTTLFIIFSIILEIIDCILYSVYFLSIKGIMEYKFISPYKCNYIIGLINTPLIIIIYFIISFTSLGNAKDNKDYYCDSIFELIESIKNINIINVIRLVSISLFYGIIVLLINKTIYDFTIYHLYIPLLVESFITGIFYYSKQNNPFVIIFLISCFCIEFIMILVFLEIIEVNICNLNKNLKRVIELRSIIESSLSIEDDYDDEMDNERKTINNENKEKN